MFVVDEPPADTATPGVCSPLGTDPRRATKRMHKAGLMRPYASFLPYSVHPWPCRWQSGNTLQSVGGFYVSQSFQT